MPTGSESVDQRVGEVRLKPDTTSRPLTGVATPISGVPSVRL
jgi:hypothetical protein